VQLWWCFVNVCTVARDITYLFAVALSNVLLVCGSIVI
jgi:hypothetical protein